MHEEMFGGGEGGEAGRHFSRCVVREFRLRYNVTLFKLIIQYGLRQDENEDEVEDECTRREDTI